MRKKKKSQVITYLLYNGWIKLAHLYLKVQEKSLTHNGETLVSRQPRGKLTYVSPVTTNTFRAFSPEFIPNLFRCRSTSATQNLLLITLNIIIMKKFYRTSAFAAMELTPLLREVLIGTMLGDCSAQKNGPKSNARLQFKQSVVNQPYIDHLYDLFKDYTGSKPLWHSQYDHRPNRSSFHHSCTFKTRSLACFTEVYNLFYSNGVKILPSNLGELLTALKNFFFVLHTGLWTMVTTGLNQTWGFSSALNVSL